MYIHCLAHSLNLAVQDTCKRSKPMKDLLDITLEVTKLIKASPKRESWFKSVKDRSLYDEEVDTISNSGIKLFCRTR